MKANRKFWIAIASLLVSAMMWITLLFYWSTSMGDITGVLIIIGSGFFGIVGLFFGANFGEHWTVMKAKIAEKNPQ